MGAKIYDSTSASWKDADAPKIYNRSNWVNSEGKVYDSSTQSWKDAWGNELLVLYDQGYEPIQGTITKWCISLPSAQYPEGSTTFCCMNYKCDVTIYNKLIIITTSSGNNGLAGARLNNNAFDDYTVRNVHPGTENIIDISNKAGEMYIGAAYTQGETSYIDYSSRMDITRLSDRLRYTFMNPYSGQSITYGEITKIWLSV